MLIFNSALLIITTLILAIKYKIIRKLKKCENFLLFLLPFLIIAEVALIIHAESPSTKSEITADGMLEYVVGALSFISTLVLSILALWQTKQLDKENSESQQLLNTMNERANEIAAQSNELNMITKIIEFQMDRYQRLEHLLYRYCELMDSNSINSILTRVKKQYAREQQEVDLNRRNEFSRRRIESQTTASNITLLLSQDCRSKNGKGCLIESMKKLDEAAFSHGIPFENDKKYLTSIEECRKVFFV